MDQKNEMKEFINKITGFEVPTDFVELAIKFENKFGSKKAALENLGKYMGYEWIVDLHVIRGYECVPFEAQLPFQTGANGENMGWLEIAPELENFKKPFITWMPLGCEVIYHGNTMNKILEGKVKYLHAQDNFKDIDLIFLNSISIQPKQVTPIEHSVNYERTKLKPIPINEIPNWRYEVTLDGVGIYAEEKFFSPNHMLLKEYDSTENAILQIKELNKKEFFASSIWLIKNTISNSYFTEEPFELILNLYDLAIESYNGLGREQISEVIKNKYKPSR